MQQQRCNRCRFRQNLWERLVKVLQSFSENVWVDPYGMLLVDCRIANDARQERQGCSTFVRHWGDRQEDLQPACLRDRREPQDAEKLRCVVWQVQAGINLFDHWLSSSYQYFDWQTWLRHGTARHGMEHRAVQNPWSRSRTTHWQASWNCQQCHWTFEPWSEWSGTGHCPCLVIASVPAWCQAATQCRGVIIISEGVHPMLDRTWPSVIKTRDRCHQHRLPVQRHGFHYLQACCWVDWKSEERGSDGNHRSEDVEVDAFTIWQSI